MYKLYTVVDGIKQYLFNGKEFSNLSKASHVQEVMRGILSRSVEIEKA